MAEENNDKPTSVQIATPPPGVKDTDDKPPKRGGAKSKIEDTEPKPKPKSRKPRGKPIQLEKKLQEFFEGIAAVAVFVNPNDAAILEQNAPALARAYAKLASENAYVKKILERLMETSAWGEAIMVTGMVALPIAANHGLIPSGFPMPMPADPSEG